MVKIDNFPFSWVSNMQIEISLSAVHYGCVALSHSVRNSLPLKIIIKELFDNLGINSQNMKFLSRFTFYEDNKSSIVVATIPRKSPDSKTIYVKYHWFRKNVGK